MKSAVEKLLELAGAPVAAHKFEARFERSTQLGRELHEILNRRNGFYAFESALLVRPFQSLHAPLGLNEWNDPTLWKCAYDDNIGDTIFFAEDIFGGQYCMHEGEVCYFDPETGIFDSMATTIEEWAGIVLSDSEVRTGYPLAHAWQLTNGALPVGKRLLPKTPFVLGGQYGMDNLYPVDDVKSMAFRASIANQIRNLPEKSQVVLKIEGHDSTK